MRSVLGFVCSTPFDVSGLLWNLFSHRSISSAPVRGGTYFLCCCKESKQRKQLFWQQSQTGNALAILTGPSPKCRPQTSTRLGARHALAPLALQQSGMRCVPVRPRFARTTGTIENQRIAAATAISTATLNRTTEWTFRRAKRKRMNDCCANSYTARCHIACRAPSRADV